MHFAEPVYFILHVLHYFFERTLFPEPGISTFDFHLVIVNELLLDHWYRGDGTMELELGPEVVQELRRCLIVAQLAKIAESEVFGPLIDFEWLDMELEHWLLAAKKLLRCYGALNSLFEPCEGFEHLLRSDGCPDGDLAFDDDVKGFSFLSMVDTEMVSVLPPIL